MSFKLRIAGVSDRPAILNIEREVYGDAALSEDDYVKITRQRNIASMVAESGSRIVGYLIYEVRGRTIDVYRIVVAKDLQRMGIGSGVLDILKSKLGAGKKHFVQMLVREHNLALQLFLRKNGFQCRKIMRDHYYNPVEDGYLFDYELPGITEVAMLHQDTGILD